MPLLIFILSIYSLRSYADNHIECQYYVVDSSQSKFQNASQKQMQRPQVRKASLDYQENQEAVFGPFQVIVNKDENTFTIQGQGLSPMSPNPSPSVLKANLTNEGFYNPKRSGPILLKQDLPRVNRQKIAEKLIMSLYPKPQEEGETEGEELPLFGRPSLYRIECEMAGLNK